MTEELQGGGQRLLPGLSHIELDALLNTLSVDFVRLAECLVSPGWRLMLSASEYPAIHYCLAGGGQIIVEGLAPIKLQPHTLVVVPSGRRFFIDATTESEPVMNKTAVAGRFQAFEDGLMRRVKAGNEPPQAIVICGYFRACYGASADLFCAPAKIIVEQFSADDRLDLMLRTALDELIAQEVGMGFMAATSMKQVLVMLLRRSLKSGDLWAERFPLLSDRHIARAFADMVVRPGHAHSVRELADTAGLSRSAFVVRFTQIFKKAPMTVLRDLRMRQAAALMATGTLSLDQVAHAVGYASRGGFFRAFKKSQDDA